MYVSPLRSIVHSLFAFVFPPVCRACDALLPDRDRWICETCFASIRTLTSNDPLYQEKRAELAADGLIAGLASVFHFEKEGTLQGLVHQLKYQDTPRIGFELGKLVGDSLHAMLGDVECAGIVPVPLHPAKLRERGYNQSAFIAKGVGERTGIAILPQLLQRIRHTKSQTTMDTREREENVADAFQLNARYAGRVSRSSFLLVDDIITTGATVRECARVLKAHGARAIYAASIAIPDHDHLP
jgi:ComF family protein